MRDVRPWRWLRNCMPGATFALMAACGSDGPPSFDLGDVTFFDVADGSAGDVALDTPSSDADASDGGPDAPDGDAGDIEPARDADIDGDPDAARDADPDGPDGAVGDAGSGDDTDACGDNGCGGCVPLALLGAPCGPCTLDTLVCDGPETLSCDGSTPCAGSAPAAPAWAEASDGTHPAFVRVRWPAVADATGYRVYRDGVWVASVDAETTFFDDVAAPSGGAPAAVSGVVATDGLDGVALRWTAPATSAGPERAFTVTAVSAGGESDGSPGDSGWRGAEPVTRYELSIDEGDWVANDEDAVATSLLLDGAWIAMPSIVAGSVSASTTDPAGVRLLAEGFSVTETPVRIRVRGVNAAGEGSPSDSVEGRWISAALEYAWSRAETPAGPFGAPRWYGEATFDASAVGLPTQFYRLVVISGRLPALTMPAVGGSAPPPPAGRPTVETDPATRIGTTGATLNGRVVSEGEADSLADVGFCWRATDATAGCAGTSAANPCGDGYTRVSLGGRASAGPLTSAVSGLTANRVHAFCAYAASTVGVAHGETAQFTTLSAGRCGNDVREAGEACDGDDILDGATCESQGFNGGALLCTDRCELDTSDCYDDLCGDGVVSGSEACDGSLDETCASLGFAPGGEGAAFCGSDCRIDTSDCEAAVCGNAVIDAGEACDGSEFGDASCRAEGFYDGTLTCASDCGSYRTSRCVQNVCGNRTVEGREVCDGAGTTPRDCSSFSTSGTRYVAGTVGCTTNCLAFDLSQCRTSPISTRDDTDGDGVANAVDNCAGTPNPNQLDFDGNGIGNACDRPIVYGVVVEEPGANRLITTASAEASSLAGAVSHSFPRDVVAGRAEVSFDDDGRASARVMDVRFADSVETVSATTPFGATSVTMRISDASMTTVGGAFSISGTSATYATGEMAGTNAPFRARFVATGSEGTTTSTIDVTPTLDSSTSAVSAFADRFTLTIDDADVALGTVQVGTILATVDVAITGLQGTIVLGR